ncbi:16S rRNA (adenine(1518)-N(6)/adenine(1519)-N(6))-dimethyltransferase RsmA [Pantoea sp. Mhis]|uniref:16S rRNA (adenine(1518)-N(6)/adenine(1519)-N(6))- dimethyltransferase RsmA n=1 Tax=Pantoea sp. Mhis TaxID=2576759 RepID=UPI00135A8CA8|nr:16S rRNA (adenine(1518)-N(6)/adenine(1519)-N(6))-dimethyltransferase RsmA [Pantoea sp. Mhis]MXP56478.1 16S rRNA (adenine(1518)-N(6)/adenine(1519)-N(6))-dimethyltransferase RsmA [Pantoea sp. Mhis]
MNHQYVHHHPHYSRKRFGQHFLKNNDIIDNIISFIQPQKKEIMVEIGPGLGALTKPISKFLDILTVIEIDRNLVKILKNHNFLEKNIIIYQEDAMNFDFFKIIKDKNQKLRIFGNLPYNISTALIFYLFQYVKVIEDMHFMLQKEVVDRLIAIPGTKNYGCLSVMSQYFCKTIPLLDVPPSAFIPRPKVNSVLVRQVPFTESRYPLTDVSLLKYITTIAFSQRRKTLNNSLKHLFTTNILDLLNINPSLRAENITLSQYCQLANWLGTYCKL